MLRAPSRQPVGRFGEILDSLIDDSHMPAAPPHHAPPDPNLARMHNVQPAPTSRGKGRCPAASYGGAQRQLPFPHSLCGVPQRLQHIIRRQIRKSRQISSTVIPPATIETTVATGMRSSRIVASPHDRRSGRGPTGGPGATPLHSQRPDAAVADFTYVVTLVGHHYVTSDRYS